MLEVADCRSFRNPSEKPKDSFAASSNWFTCAGRPGRQTQYSLPRTGTDAEINFERLPSVSSCGVSIRPFHVSELNFSLNSASAMTVSRASDGAACQVLTGAFAGCGVLSGSAAAVSSPKCSFTVEDASRPSDKMK